MTNEERFAEVLGVPVGAEQAFMLNIPAGTGNPVSLLSRRVPSGAKVKIDGSVIYVKAESFTHPDAVLLNVA